MDQNGQTAAQTNVKSLYILISKIPLEFHSADLRNFFSYSIETDSFICFNYRHRPHSSKLYNECICQIHENKLDELIKLYDGKNWLNSRGLMHKNKCSITRIKVNDKHAANKSDSVEKSSTLDETELKNLLEFRNIPKWMPQGNVGTPTRTFLTYINQCIMPQSLISKLGLNMNMVRKYNKKRQYRNLPYDYDGKKLDHNELLKVSHVDVATTANGHQIKGDFDDEKLINELNYAKRSEINDTKEEENHREEAEDDEETEEWDRHEALHDDVTKQDRTSPYFFENEIELQWEKGGSGLVFYTDENYWKEQENKDFDAETADDLDVDMSAYYNGSNAVQDKDARDLLEINKMEMLRNGVETQFVNDEQKDVKLNSFKRKDREPKRIKYEDYGRKQLEKLGWKEGEPVGNPLRSGLIEPLDGAESGKKPLDRTGLGYFGDKVDRLKMTEIQQKYRHLSKPYHIGSKYDQDLNTQNKETLLRRFDPVIKYRKKM